MKTRDFHQQNEGDLPAGRSWSGNEGQHLRVPEVSKIDRCVHQYYSIFIYVNTIYNYIYIYIYIYVYIYCYTMLYHLRPLHHGYHGDLFINKNLLRQNHSLQDQSGYSDWYSSPKRHQCLISKNEHYPFPFRQMSLRNNRFFFVLLWMADAPLCRAKCNIRLQVSVAHTHTRKCSIQASSQNHSDQAHFRGFVWTFWDIPRFSQVEKIMFLSKL